MDFFVQQDLARRNSKSLVFLFALAVIAVTAALYFLIATLVIYEGYSEAFTDVQMGYWQPTTLLWTAVTTFSVVGLVSLVKVFRLRAGGSAVAEMMGARLVAPGSADADERRLLNVVEEMSIASGLSVPLVYILEEPGINAFAAGYSIDDAAVVVTRGALKAFNRDELQGVIAHEFSHVIYGDMRLNIRLMGVLAGLVFIGTIGRMLVHGGSRNRKGGGAVVAGLAIMLIGSIGVFFGRLIQSAVSRQREFLADAAAVQFTRNPEGIGGALKKILSGHSGSAVDAGQAAEVSHMFFANALDSWGFSLFATHPPLEERIQRIQPSFAGELPSSAPGQVVLPAAASGVASGLASGAAAPASSVASSAGAMGLAPMAAAAKVGQVEPEAITRGRALIDGLPPSLVGAARSPLGAIALVYGLLIDRDEPLVAETQRQILRDGCSPAVLRELKGLLADITALRPTQRLPLISLAAPSLRELVPSQRKRLDQLSAEMVCADARVSVFEFCLQHFVAVRDHGARAPLQTDARKLAPQFSTLLSALVHAGHDDYPTAIHAFDEAKKQLPPEAERLAAFQPPESGWRPLRNALRVLGDTTPRIKKHTLAACVAAVAHDGVIRTDEAELVRTIAHALHLPMPSL